jgi:hypothetical protein
MKMKCKDIKFKLVDYFENTLSPEEKKLVQSHLDTCSRCQKEYEKIVSTFEMLKKESPIEPGEIYWTNFVPAVRSRIEKKEETGVVIIPKWKFAGGIVTFFLILLLGIFLSRNDRRVMFKSGAESYTYLLPAEDEKIEELFYAEEDESSLRSLITEADRKKLVLAEEELEEYYWEKGGKEKRLEELDIKQLEDLKKTLEKEKFKKEIL